VSGDSAYLVVPAVYSFKAKDGAAMREPGQFAFVLHKAAGGWKIASWAWAGGKLRPAAAAK
jgi:ketosteroid isomerase-like protein